MSSTATSTNLASNESMDNCTNNNTDQYRIDELKIPINYGFIAAKIWRPHSTNDNLNDNFLKILAIHGWQVD